MRHYNGWLWGQLRDLYGDRVEASYNPLISISRVRMGVVVSNHKIWCPTPEDYRITRDCVEEVHEIGGDIISFASQWSQPSAEGIARARELEMKVMPHAATFSFFK